MSLYGASLHTTPQLEKFAATGVVFDRFIAGSNATTPSVATLLSGADASHNRVQQMGGYFTNASGIGPEDLLPGRLRKAGYRTAAITANSSAHAGRLHIAGAFDDVVLTGSPCRPMQWLWSRLGNTNMLGMDAYFERQVRINAWLSRILCRGRTVTDVPSEASYSRALSWIDASNDSGRPFFLWLQTLPPHDPYLPPPPFRASFDQSERFLRYDDAGQQYLYKMNPGPAQAADIAILRNRYAENLAYADHAAGEFLDSLRRRGLLENTIVVVTSDHGESFGRWIGHQGPFLDQSLISVPLIISGPGIGKGRRIEDLASHADLAPTLLDMAGLPPGAAMQGRSLRGLLAGESLPARPVYSMQIETSPRSGPIARGTVAVLDGNWKYVRYLQDGREELFDLSRDPLEANNLARTDADIAARLGEMIRQRLTQDQR
jgi:arylsulfatase A-like enzyme